MAVGDLLPVDEMSGGVLLKAAHLRYPYAQDPLLRTGQLFQRAHQRRGGARHVPGKRDGRVCPVVVGLGLLPATRILMSVPAVFVIGRLPGSRGGRSVRIVGLSGGRLLLGLFSLLSSYRSWFLRFGGGL